MHDLEVKGSISHYEPFPKSLCLQHCREYTENNAAGMESSSGKPADFNSLVGFLTAPKPPDISSKASMFQKSWENLSCQVAKRKGKFTVLRVVGNQLPPQLSTSMRATPPTEGTFGLSLRIHLKNSLIYQNSCEEHQTLHSSGTNGYGKPFTR